MPLPLVNLPEDQFASWLPPRLLDEDVRAVLRAVVGGYQERISDLRYAINKVALSYEPKFAPPSNFQRTLYTETYADVSGGANYPQTLTRYASQIETVTVNGISLYQVAVLAAGNSASYAVTVSSALSVLQFGDGVHGAFIPFGATLVITYATQSGDTAEVVYNDGTGIFTRVLDCDESTPPEYDTESLNQWAATAMGIDPCFVTEVTIGTDAIRVCSASTLAALAANFGAVLYTNPLLSTLDNLAQQRAQAEGIFPRLKIKGTVSSFDVLGRVLGFTNASMVPLWGRMSPRNPADVGDSQNDADFAASPQIFPSLTLPDPDLDYDPYNVTDGPFYTWQSGPLSSTPADRNYYPYAINGLNPYVKVIQMTLPAYPPAVGAYYLQGGAPYVKARVSLNSTIALEAICDGDSFNGMRIDVVSYMDLTGATQSKLVIRGRLSKIKYRTSLYDLNLYVDSEAFDEAFGLVPVSANVDAQALNGSGCANGLPLAGSPPTYATPATLQQQMSLLQTMGAQSAQAFESIRPATRQPRRVNVGFSFTDCLGYAPYSSQAEVSSGSLGYQSGFVSGYPPPCTLSGTTVLGGSIQHNGTIAPLFYLEAPIYFPSYTASFFAQKGSTVYPQLVERLPVNPDQLRISGAFVVGSYFLSTGSYALTVRQACDGIFAQWLSTTTDRVQPTAVGTPVLGTDADDYLVTDNGDYILLVDSYQTATACQLRPEDDLLFGYSSPPVDLLGTDNGYYLGTDNGDYIELNQYALPYTGAYLGTDADIYLATSDDDFLATSDGAILALGGGSANPDYVGTDNGDYLLL